MRAHTHQKGSTVGIRNLVLEVTEGESAQDLQARLNRAGDDGFFLVNAVGRLLLLRASVVPRKTPTRTERQAGNATALQYLKDHWELPCRVIAKACEKENGVVRSYRWFQVRKKDV
jgi:hypothetical protein